MSNENENFTPPPVGVTVKIEKVQCRPDLKGSLAVYIGETVKDSEYKLRLFNESKEEIILSREEFSQCDLLDGGSSHVSGNSGDNGSDSQLPTTTANDEDIQRVNRTMFIPKSRAGEFIGRKGSNIRILSKKTGALISVSKDSCKGGTMREVRISGTHSAVELAEEVIKQFCISQPIPEKASSSSLENNEDKQETNALETSASPKAASASYSGISSNAPNSGGSKNGDSGGKALLSFLHNHRDCFKCKVKDFHKWLASEDVFSLRDLAEALNDDSFVRSEMQRNGLKGFKRPYFSKATLSALDEAQNPRKSGGSEAVLKTGLSPEHWSINTDYIKSESSAGRSLQHSSTPRPRKQSSSFSSARSTSNLSREHGSEEKTVTEINTTRNNLWFKAFQEGGRELRELSRDRDSLPKDENGRELCLTYQLKGRCYSGCSRTESHRPLTVREKRAFQAFVDAKLLFGNNKLNSKSSEDSL